MTITLSTPIGSRGVTVTVEPSALVEAGVGAVQLEIGGLHDGRLVLQFTQPEALEFLEQLEEQAHADWPVLELVVKADGG